MISSRNSSDKICSFTITEWHLSRDWVKRVAIEVSFLLLPQIPYKINGGNDNVLGREISDFLYSLFLFHILSFELRKVFEESAGRPINSFSPSSLFSCFFSRTLSWKRSLFFFLFALYKTFLSFSRETPYSSSCLSVRRSFCKPAGRKRPATLLSRHCLSEQTAWSCLRAKWGRLMRQ